MALHKRGWITLIAAAVLFVAGAYLLLLAYAPAINVPIIGLQKPDVRKIMASTPPGEVGNWLYIPKIDLSMPIAEGGSDVLLHNIWHRQPQNGNPEKGGNFVLSGHRFSLGWTPGETTNRSPLYNIDKVGVGDELFVDYNGTRYTYKVSSLYQVPPDATRIEGPSTSAKLTLYSCDLRGAAVGRYVVEALPQ